MDDRFNEQNQLEHDEESDVENTVSSDEEDINEYFFTKKDGKDVLRSRNDIEGDLELNMNINDENLLYDPNVDAQNEKWMKDQRTHTQKHESKEGELKKSPRSDAMLSCPACMTTVCVDCQRHQIYKNQYRAMFVMNCSVDADQFLRYEQKNVSKKRRKRFGTGKLVPCDAPPKQNNDDVTQDDGTDESAEYYNPVKCDSCSTELAVFDHEEIYHFFNVIESIA